MIIILQQIDYWGDSFRDEVYSSCLGAQTCLTGADIERDFNRWEVPLPGFADPIGTDLETCGDEVVGDCLQKGQALVAVFIEGSRGEMLQLPGMKLATRANGDDR